MIYKPKYFRLEELVPPDMFATVPAKYLWWALDWRVLWTADRLRERYGKMIANTWLWGGDHKERGLRDPMTSTGAAWSQHKFGRALDLVPVETTAEEIREDIRAETAYPYAFKYITCIETGVPWLHFDDRNWEGGLLEVAG